ncbi:MAG: phage antirepressor KilAC domain-containing protein [Pseudomonadota bacterium]
MCITDVAKTLKMTPKQLFSFLSINSWIYKRPDTTNWIGHQDKINSGYLEHSEYVYRDRYDSERVKTTVKVTAKGIAKIAKMFESASLN